MTRNPIVLTTLKAYKSNMPLRWWRSWLTFLWKTRKYPRLRRGGGPIHKGFRYALYHTRAIQVERARRLERFKSELEVRKSDARSFNARLKLNSASLEERRASLQERLSKYYQLQVTS